MCHEGYMHSLVSTVMTLPKANIDVSIKTITNESLRTRARNHIADAFVENKDFTHLLFIDSDITFSPEQIIRMVKIDKDFVVGSYPHKAYDWTSLYNLIKKKPDINLTELEATILRYSGSMMSVKDSETGKHNVIEENGFVRGCWDCPTGFMMIKKEVFEKMIAKIGEEIYYINDLPQTSDDGLSVVINEKKQYAFFNAEVDPGTKKDIYQKIIYFVKDGYKDVMVKFGLIQNQNLHILEHGHSKEIYLHL